MRSQSEITVPLNGMTALSTPQYDEGTLEKEEEDYFNQIEKLSEQQKVKAQTLNKSKDKQSNTNKKKNDKDNSKVKTNSQDKDKNQTQKGPAKSKSEKESNDKDKKQEDLKKEEEQNESIIKKLEKERRDEQDSYHGNDKDQQAITFGGQCKKNEDCRESSWCCSAGRCVPGSTCFHGSKIINDFCENNYECLSRCCSSSSCSKFDKCAETCEKNDDCVGDTCCSFGWCSSKTVCDGRKDIGDLCSTNYECMSHNCSMDEIAQNWGKNKTQMNNAKSQQTEISYKYPSYKKHPSMGICEVKEDEGPFEPMTIIQVLIVMFALIVISIALYYFCRSWSSRGDNGQNQGNRQQNIYGSNNGSDRDSTGRIGKSNKRQGRSSRDGSQQRSDRSGQSSDGGSSGKGRRHHGSSRKHDRQYQQFNSSRQPLVINLNENKKRKMPDDQFLSYQRGATTNTSTSSQSKSLNSKLQRQQQLISRSQSQDQLKQDAKKEYQPVQLNEGGQQLKIKLPGKSGKAKPNTMYQTMPLSNSNFQSCESIDQHFLGDVNSVHKDKQKFNNNFEILQSFK